MLQPTRLRYVNRANWNPPPRVCGSVPVQNWNSKGEQVYVGADIRRVLVIDWR